MNPCPLLNQSAVKKFLLEYSQKTRAHKFNRVSSATLIYLNNVVRRAATGVVTRLPSKGKTI